MQFRRRTFSASRIRKGKQPVSGALEIKRTLGTEFSRAGLFPPSQYFLARTAQIAKPKRPTTARRKAIRQRAAAHKNVAQAFPAMSAGKA
jgi:predicted LPLAT superfamily acyltransferase